MASKTLHSILPILALTVFAALRLQADVVETKDGSRIVGKITKIDGGSVSLDTTYAGSITIKQSEVVGIQTDGASGVRLSSGVRVQGVVSTQAGEVRAAAQGGQVATSVDKIAALWPKGGEDPKVAALERHWKFETQLDVNGQSGNKSQLGTELGFHANYGNSVDMLQLYTDYNRQVTNGEKSADQFKAGVDYADNFQDGESWYVRNEAGFDRIMGVSLYDIAAAGLGYGVIDTKKENLTVRAGLAYRYDKYNDDVTSSVSSVGADFELNHWIQFSDSKITNRLAIDPAFENLNNFVIEHESAYEIPLSAPGWKLRLGVANDYNSKPAEGLKKLDTTYFTRLILSL